VSDAIIIAANGDDHGRRNARGPDVTHQRPRVYAHADEHSERTGLGVNEVDLLIAIVDRYSQSSPE
jgi:hypothetical protein